MFTVNIKARGMFDDEPDIHLVLFLSFFMLFFKYRYSVLCYHCPLAYKGFKFYFFKKHFFWEFFFYSCWKHKYFIVCLCCVNKCSTLKNLFFSLFCMWRKNCVEYVRWEWWHWQWKNLSLIFGPSGFRLKPISAFKVVFQNHT